jgi:hypothetical protein
LCCRPGYLAGCATATLNGATDAPDLVVRVRLLAVVALATVVTFACTPAPPAATARRADAYRRANAPAPTLTTGPLASPTTASTCSSGVSHTTQRDLRLATDAGFHWQKSLFPWRQVEGAAKGQFDWTEADRVVRASTAAGVKIIARLDFEPDWARADHAHNGPPDDYQDYWDYVSAFVSRYSTSSTIGRVQAIEIWNEPNIDREWGNQTIGPDSAADYVRLLRGAYRAAHAADPNIMVLSAGLDRA